MLILYKIIKNNKKNLYFESRYAVGEDTFSAIVKQNDFDLEWGILIDQVKFTNEFSIIIVECW